MKKCFAAVSTVVALCLTTNSAFAAPGLAIPKVGWAGEFRWSFADPACQAALKAQQSTMAALNVGYDNDGLWDWGDPKREGPEVLNKMVDQYADAGAKFIIWGCGNYKAWSYTPKVQELWGAEMSTEAQKNPNYRKQGALLESYIAAGTDPLSIVLKRAEVRKLPVLAGFRYVNLYMNDCPNSWFADNPRFHLSRDRNPFPDKLSGVNFALPEVREYKVRQWTDVVERYDVEGLHLEFLRSVPFFEKDEPNKIEHMNALVRMLRKELDRIGQKRGKRLKLSIWLPTPDHLRILRPMFRPDLFDMAAQGLDPEVWIKEGLVDILMPTVYAPDLGMAKPVAIPPWVKTAKGSSTKVYACVTGITSLRTTAASTADVLCQLAPQYDGLFLFNGHAYTLAVLLEAAAAAKASGAQQTPK